MNGMSIENTVVMMMLVDPDDISILKCHVDTMLCGWRSNMA